MRKKAEFGHFLLCMFILIVSTIGFYVWDLEKAKQDYIVEHNVPDNYHRAQKGIIWDDNAYYTKPQLAYDQIGDKFQSVLWHTFLFLIFYPLFGRLLVLLAQGLTSLFDALAKDLNIQIDRQPVAFNNWTPEIVLYGAVLSPITAIAIGLLLIANLLMFIYRFLI